MTDLNDKRIRQALIRRYLNAETTIEEEQLLLDYYMLTKEELTPEEEDMRHLIVSTAHLAEDIGLSAEKEVEFDKMMEGGTAVGKNRKNSSMLIWPSSMVAALIVALFLLTKGTINDTPESEPYAKMTSTTSSSQQTYSEEEPQQKGEEADVTMAEDEDRDAKGPTTMDDDKGKQEEDRPVSGEDKQETAAEEALESGMPDAMPANTSSRFVMDELNYRRYPQNVSAANYNGGHDDYRFVPSGNITIVTKTIPNGNVSHYTVVNTGNGMKMLQTEIDDDSVIYIVDGIKVTKDFAILLSPDIIKEKRRLKRGTKEAIKVDPAGQHHDVILMKTKKSDTDGENHSLAPYRNGLLVFDNHKINGICLL